MPVEQVLENVSLTGREARQFGSFQVGPGGQLVGDHAHPAQLGSDAAQRLFEVPFPLGADHWPVRRGSIRNDEPQNGDGACRGALHRDQLEQCRDPAT